MEILGYFEEWSRRGGDTVRLAVSTRLPEVEALFERILSGPGEPGESKVETEIRADILSKRFPGRWQETAVGSWAKLALAAPPAAAPRAVSVHCWLWPTLPELDRRQTIWALDNGLSLAIEDGVLVLRQRGSELARSIVGLVAQCWYSAAVILDGDRATLDVEQVRGLIAASRGLATGRGASFTVPAAILLATDGLDAAGSPRAAYNGKIDRPTVYYRMLSRTEIAALRAGADVGADSEWAFDRDFGATAVAGRGRCPGGTLHNGVERAVTGPNWDGHSDSFVETPGEYTALQFHEDDMVDSGWEYDLAFDLPPDIQSGVYCVRLTAGSSVERIPLFVLGAPAETADVLMLMPTNTYLAYANERLVKLDFSSVMAHAQTAHPDDLYLAEHREFGRSCYDTHVDGTPCRYSSRRRPIIQVRPGFPNWLTDSYRHFAVDLYFVEWLETRQRSYHVATDEDLEREGRALLDKYKVVVTGSHPEYWTRHGRGVLDSYLRSGGRMMYLGGNGFYWVTSRDAERPWIIEVRRDNSGTRCWDAPAGERGHVYTLEQGGIWKNRGLGPHRLVGIGFCAEGWSQGCGYKRAAASYEGIGGQFFRGVNEEVVGDFGHVLGGAVGDEIDRFDVALGSPVHAVLLASSTGVGREYIHVIEEQNVGLPDKGGDALPDLVRSDMVYFEIEGGGSVFAAGSITLVGSMAWNGFDNSMARVIDNALDVMLTPAAG